MGNTREVKCKEAAQVMKALKGLDVLCVGGLAVEAVDPKVQWGTHEADELDLLIHHTDVDAFMTAMEDGGYVLAEYDGGKWKTIPKGQVASAIRRMPVSPEYNYAPKSCTGKPEEPHLWIAFHTTTRHGRLMLADLAEWFEGKEKYDGDFGLTVYRPPQWAVLLWQAAEVVCKAAEQSIARFDIDRMRALAGAQSDTWDDVLDKAAAYEVRYRQLLDLPAAKKRFDTYRERLGLSDTDMEEAERRYDARYELSHALRAVKDAVPSEIWEKLAPVISDRPRKVWGYPGVKGSRPVYSPESSGGELGIAREDFGIEEQLKYCEANPNATYCDLVKSKLVATLIPSASKPDGPTAPPHGPWQKFTPDDMKDMGL